MMLLYTAFQITALLGLQLPHFGSIGEKLTESNPWYGFRDDNATLWVVRAEKVDGITNESCQKWIQNLERSSPGKFFPFDKKDTFDSSDNKWESWSPWTSEDIKDIEKCDSLPCAIKLNASEIESFKASSIISQLPKASKKTHFLNLIHNRMKDYHSTLEKKGCEYPGIPIDPWQEIEKNGFTSDLPKPSTIELYLRTIKLGKSTDMKPIRQVLDSRFTKNNHLAVRWTKDIYTNHYFDSCGEWTKIDCSLQNNQLIVLQVWVVEFDLLKNKDILSVLSKGKMKLVIQEQGFKYLDDKIHNLKGLDF